MVPPNVNSDSMNNVPKRIEKGNIKTLQWVNDVT